MGQPTKAIFDETIANPNAQIVGNDMVRAHVLGVTSPKSTIQTLSSFEEYTSLVTHPKEVEETLGTPMEVEPSDKTQLEDIGLNTCNHDIPLSSRIKVVETLTIYTPPSPHVASFHPKDLYCYYCPCIDDPKKHYGFKPGLLGHSRSLGVDFSKLGMIEDDWELESKEVYFLRRGLNLLVRPNEVEKVRIRDSRHLENIFPPIFQHKTLLTIMVCTVTIART
ncbi:hypothetical protein Tco_0452811 [Tanacetum coccineum]